MAHFCNERLLPGECISCVGKPRPVVLRETWAGTVSAPVELLKRTPKRYRVRFLEKTTGIAAGEVRYVPHEAVRMPGKDGR